MDGRGMTVPRVFGFGTATLAFRARVGTGMPEALGRDVATDVGGDTASALVQAARLGLHACWLGKLGDDWIGHRILAALEEETVDCSGALLDAAACSPFRVVTTDGEGASRTTRLAQALARLRLDELHFLADTVDAGEWVVVEVGELPLPLVSAFCSRMKRRGAQILLTVDLDPIRQLAADPVDLQMLLGQADVLVPNHTAIRPLCETDNPEIMAADLARRYHCMAVLWTTEGAWYCDASGLGDECPADLAEAVDLSGSEAAFRGGLLACLAQDRGMPKALALGVECATRTAFRKGNWNGMPRSTELALDS
jgi:sugar/nucleoside kinase (ribokinase family)